MFAFGLSYILKLCFADTEHSLETGWLVPSAPENVLERLCSVYEGIPNEFASLFYGHIKYVKA